MIPISTEMEHFSIRCRYVKGNIGTKAVCFTATIAEPLDRSGSRFWGGRWSHGVCVLAKRRNTSGRSRRGNTGSFWTWFHGIAASAFLIRNCGSIRLRMILAITPSRWKWQKIMFATGKNCRELRQGYCCGGSVGTGKSFLAGCITNALLDKGVPVIMTNFARLLNRLTDMYAGDRNAYIDSFKRYPLMIIDDLGVERNSEFAREQVFSVIDSRYRSQLPMIVTINLSLQELQHPADLSRARIYDRILERCTPIRVNDQNIREQNKKSNIESAKQILGTS